MTATDNLRRMLDERGVEWGNVRDDGSESDYLTEWEFEGIQSYAVATEWSVGGGLSVETHRHGLTPEQAIAATLGSELPYDELLRCLENDWHISASWDGLRKFWCIELTEEGVKLRNSAHNTLTAEQVRDVIEVAKAELLESCKYLGDYEQRTNDVLKAFGKMEQEIAETLGTPVTGETSDGYHTFNELYHHRAVLFSVIVRDHREMAWKSKAHHDGTMYDGMFIVGIETPEGQATYHYDIDPYWDMFDCKELDRAPEWDGHTPDDAIERIATLGNEESYTRDDVESAFVSGYSLGCLPVGSDPQWDQNEQTVDEHMAELGWVRAELLPDMRARVVE